VVDHGPENARSPDGALYMVASGCRSASGKATENCTWISGDGIFVARAAGFSADDPQSLNNAKVWSFWSGTSAAAGDVWSPYVKQAKPVFRWRGRVGAVTATWEPTRKVYLFCITAPAVGPANISGEQLLLRLATPALPGWHVAHSFLLALKDRTTR